MERIFDRRGPTRPVSTLSTPLNCLVVRASVETALFIVEALRRLILLDTLYRRRSTIADTVDRADVPNISNYLDGLVSCYAYVPHPTTYIFDLSAVIVNGAIV